MTALDEYYQALQRLKSSTPVRVPKGTKITKDSVALEAGRKRSSIKKSRPVFEQLIIDIDIAVEEQLTKKKNPNKVIEELKSEKSHYRKLYQQALNRELMLIKRIDNLERYIKRSKVKVPEL